MLNRFKQYFTDPYPGALDGFYQQAQPFPP